MECPSCKVNLVMTDRNGIEIDYCPNCRGVWLDRGELDKIIERSIPEVRTAPQNQPNVPNYLDRQQNYSDRQHHYSENDYRYKKKKGLLGDLFDF
jgi:Zn-finger nucleic acid-binding protein